MPAKLSSESEGQTPDEELAEEIAALFSHRDVPGNLEKAAGLYEKVTGERIDGRHPACYALARVYALLGDWEKALQIWERLITSGLWPTSEKGLEGWDRTAFLEAHDCPRSAFAPLSLPDLLTQSLERCRSHFGSASIQVKVDAEYGLPHVSGIEKNLRRVLLIVLENAFEATLEAGYGVGSRGEWGYEPLPELLKMTEPKIRIEVKADRKVGRVRFACRDYGIGLPKPWIVSEKLRQELIDRRKHLFGGDVERTKPFIRGALPQDDAELVVWMFTPGWTSKGKGWQRNRPSLENGPGLGLYMAKQILHKHAGSISIKRAKASGTAVEICLPAR